MKQNCILQQFQVNFSFFLSQGKCIDVEKVQVCFLPFCFSLFTYIFLFFCLPHPLSWRSTQCGICYSHYKELDCWLIHRICTPVSLTLSSTLKRSNILAEKKEKEIIWRQWNHKSDSIKCFPWIIKFYV